MDQVTQTCITNIRSADKDAQNAAYYALLEATEQPVHWAYEVWDDLLAGLRDRDNHVRAIAAQLLSNLAKSDPDGRMLESFDALLNVTRDEKFVTARHALQSLWKIGLAGEAQKQKLLDSLEMRFIDCATEKNCTLIRYDIALALRSLYDASPDDTVKAKALALIATETDDKYRRKYASAWRGISGIK